MRHIYVYISISYTSIIQLLYTYDYVMLTYFYKKI